MKRLFLLLSLTLFLHGKEMVGKVLALEGTAVSGTKTLARGVAIFTEDVIRVGTHSKVQIRFTDGALLNLMPNSEYRVNSYKYKEGKGGTSEGEAIKGALRYLSGEIGKSNPDAVTIKTPTATIGLRGTVLDAVVGGECGLIAGCQLGLIAVKNEAGEIVIGPDKDFSFLRACSAQVPPQGLKEMPQDLSPQIFTSPPGGVTTTPTGANDGTGSPSTPGTTPGGGTVRIQAGC